MKKKNCDLISQKSVGAKAPQPHPLMCYASCFKKILHSARDRTLSSARVAAAQLTTLNRQVSYRDPLSYERNLCNCI